MASSVVIGRGLNADESTRTAIGEVIAERMDSSDATADEDGS